MRPIRLVEIFRTTHAEKNFYLVTDLTDDEIKSVTEPIAMKQRNDPDFCFDNEMLVDRLMETYSDDFIQYYEEYAIGFIIV